MHQDRNWPAVPDDDELLSRSTRLSRSGSAARAAESPIDVITQWSEAVPGTL
jgi:mevalonate pyrophosphate decarboxylase